MSRAILCIELGAIAKNWAALDALSAASVQTGAVVKASAYGLGLAPVVKKLFAQGARHFFVATAYEGAQLRPLLASKAKIYVFNGYMAGEKDLFAQHDIIALLNSERQIKRFFDDFTNRPYGIQLDTGMNRLGIPPDHFVAHKDIAANSALIISHLACSDQRDHPMNAQQLAAFKGLTDDLAVPRSLAATGGVLLGADYHFDMTRPGIGLYGGLPFAQAESVVRLDLPIIQTRPVRQGETVGYGNQWVARRDSVIATLASGYGDGLLRALGNGTVSLYAGHIACPLIGRVSMDLISVNVSEIASLPTHLSILNQRQSIDDLAKAAGTIGYEILTALGARYERQYKA